MYAGKSTSPLRGGSPAEPEVGGQTEAYGRCLSPLTLPPLTGTHTGDAGALTGVPRCCEVIMFVL